MPTIDCRLHLLQGRNLSIKDRTSSDPFVRLYLDDGSSSCSFDSDDGCLFQSRAKSQTVDPKFNEKFHTTLTDASVVDRVISGGAVSFVLSIFDEDGMHGEDGMGFVRVPITTESSDEATLQWYPVEGGGQGELQVKLEVVVVDD